MKVTYYKQNKYDIKKNATVYLKDKASKAWTAYVNACTNK